MWQSMGSAYAQKRGRSPPMDAKTILIALLAIGLIVVGYFYYENSRHGITIDTPAVKIEAK
jgi:hypothetical protein